MFSKILIANRGAIATRATKTFKRLGIKSVAVYSEHDKDSQHAAQADESYLLESTSDKTPYLDKEQILQIALDSGAEAIFPGYGFLSENYEFAAQCENAGIKFIGPSPKSMQEFGLKHTARELALAAGVPLAPGTDLLDSLDIALKETESIGYPIMLKSTAGGGGIGIKICHGSEELAEAFETTAHLAEANFGNAGVYLERYVENARHIEVQIFGTDKGIIVLGDRDCSIQRRNQKVVEECPAPNLPEHLREQMYASARSLGELSGYINAGTVEFLYDANRGEFYFLEVNTRLQVEHGITEECFGVDLVEWMVRQASGDEIDTYSLSKTANGHSIEVRLYAEDCLNNFIPSTGAITLAEFSQNARVETWIQNGVEVTSFYDPMLAKIIVHADTRSDAIDKMLSVLSDTKVYGITTNKNYLSHLLDTDFYRSGKLSTHALDDFHPTENAIEVIDGGILTSVQDYPGIVGYWAVGVPPCGPFDTLSFRAANAIVGNDESAAGLEFTLRGGTYKFRGNTTFALSGADMHATLNGVEVPRYCKLYAKAGDILKLEQCEIGMRAYLTVKGGLDVPKVLGSRSTFIDGKFGGHAGRPLRTRDVIGILKNNTMTSEANPQHKDVFMQAAAITPWSHEWTLGVLIGPLSDREFLLPDFLTTLTSTAYEVNYDSARTGIRLNGPTPEWSRTDGGEAGLHPSNIHDNPYSMYALDLTGDQPILLGPDGPSLGGFVCPVVVAVAERWKLGQMRPGDKVRFKIIDTKAAEALRSRNKAVPNMVQSPDGIDEPSPEFKATDCFLYTSGCGDDAICMRQSGEDAVLVEYGPMKLDIKLRFRVHVLMAELQKQNISGVIDITPGIRSLQIHFDPDLLSQKQIVDIIVDTDKSLPALEDITVRSRIVHLPLSWDDPQTQLAAKRYMETTRPNAPWCPSNLEFIRRINGLDSIDDVKKIFFDARYLVLGLGDVYLGAPVATPVDPRHKLVTTKYNPARPWTPENAVGIGGAYLCVYGMEGPGGYQFTGRTTQMWNKIQSTETFKEGKPWLLDFFDQLQFYEVSAEELLELREYNLRGKFNVQIEETTFNLGDYLQFLQDNEESIKSFKQMQEAAFEAEHQRWIADGLDVFVSETSAGCAEGIEELDAGCVGAYSEITGALWKYVVSENDKVSEGDTIAIMECMKMEFSVNSPADGFIKRLFARPGDILNPGELICEISPVE